MPEKYVPKHRDEPPKRVRAGAKNAVLYSGVAVFATSLSVGAGIAGAQQSSDGAAVKLAAGRAPVTAADAADREQSVSRAGTDRTSQAATFRAAA